MAYAAVEVSVSSAVFVGFRWCCVVEDCLTYCSVLVFFFLVCGVLWCWSACEGPSAGSVLRCMPLRVRYLGAVMS